MEGDADVALLHRFLATDVHLDRARAEIGALDPGHAVTRRGRQPHAIPVLDSGGLSIDHAQFPRIISKSVNDGL